MTDAIVVRLPADINIKDVRLVCDDISVMKVARNLVVLLNGTNAHRILVVCPYVDVLAVLNGRSIDLYQNLVEFRANLLVDKGEGVKCSTFSRCHSCRILTDCWGFFGDQFVDLVYDVEGHTEEILSNLDSALVCVKLNWWIDELTERGELEITPVASDMVMRPPLAMFGEFEAMEA